MATITQPSSSKRQPLAFDAVLARVYTINWEVVVYTAILIVAVLTRFWDLGVRVMSHDESLHTYYSWELFETGNFDHTPLMHGPLLFHATAFFYFLFGDNDFSARIYTALLGVAIVMFPLLFRRWLGKWGAIFASVGFLISPMMLYYSRYIRHDIPSIFFALVMLWCTMEYVDGRRERRPIYIAILAGAMSLLLASKEVSFFYIAIFGSFLTLYWIMRMIQDAEIFQRIGHTYDSHSTQALLINYRKSPGWVLTIGHLLIVMFSLVLGYLAGSLFYSFYEVGSGIFPEDIPETVWQLIFAGLLFAAFESIGFVRTFASAGRPEPGMAGMFANGFKNMRSTLMLITAGAVLGSVMSLWAFSMLYMVDPSGDRAENRIIAERVVVTQEAGETVERVERFVNATERDHFIQWAFFPILLLVFVVLLIAAIKSTPWQDVLAIFLVAVTLAGGLFYFERSSHPPRESLSTQAVAVDPNATDEAAATDDINRTPILLSIIFNMAVVVAVVVSRFTLPYAWAFMNRQPVFDVLIAMGTMIYPWLSAFPLFWAGYQLDLVDRYAGELLASGIITLIPFLLVSASVGLAWNWRVWPLVVAVFTALFLVFFTTFFTNGRGVGTGVIGSLGYWLEQQDVRRGSQPQYYYLFIQLPVYEFLPTILTALAGFAGLSWLFEHRRDSRRAEIEARREHEATIAAKREDVVADDAYRVTSSDQEAETPDDTVLSEERQTAQFATTDAGVAAETEPEYDDADEDREWLSNVEADHAFRTQRPPMPRWAEEYDHDEELARRDDPSNIEYLGGIPLLQLIAYWAALVLVSLSIAGEKMPWLTTHLTLPFIFIGGWYLGRIVEQVDWSNLKRSGWALLLLVLPVFFIALWQMVLPFATSGPLPFRGDNAQLGELTDTSRWMAAFLAVAITGYFIVQTSFEIGWKNSRRLMFSAGALVLAVLTMRAAWVFSYVNYDLPTEFGVYAHAGPAVKDTLDDLYYMAERHPDGMNMQIAYDDTSSWPLLWYLRDFENKRFICCNADAVENNREAIESSMVVIVGSDKRAEVSRLLGDDFYMRDLTRLWWPMQDYFFLNYDGINETLQSDTKNPAAGIMRESIWNIWWERDYDLYAEAKCMDDRIESQCFITDPENPDAAATLDNTCVQRVRNECRGDSTFEIERWPVSDGLYVYVRSDFAVQIWDSGMDGRSVAERLVPDPEDQVMRDVSAIDSFGTGLFNGAPTDMVFGPEGLLYIADRDTELADGDDSRVLVYDPEARTLVRIIGEGQLSRAQGLAISPVDGYLYVADTWYNNHGRVAVFTLDGEFVTGFGNSGAGNPNFAFFGPREVDVDRNGFIYVSDTGNHRIRVYDPQWQFMRDITSAGSGLNNDPEPVGLAVHPISGQLYIAETWNAAVSVFRRDGTFVRAWDVNMWAGTRGNNNRPYLTISPDGTMILVSDMDNNETNNGPRVVAYDLSGQAMTAFNAPLDAAEGTGPLGVQQVAGMAFDAEGNLYVADEGAGRVVVFPPLTVSGSLQPRNDFTYTGEVPGNTNAAPGDVDEAANPEADTEQVVPPAVASDIEAVEQVGLAYWQAQTEGDYAAWLALHCEADQLLEPDVRDEEDFFLDTAAYRYPANYSEFIVEADVDGNAATASFDGVLSLFRDNEEFRIAAVGLQSIELVKQAGVWRVCANADPEENADIFRPGGR
jgi:DNA-binding beta-propeller fold protein YncE/ABC-type multidrug transport system fused ATPase/permease subunit